MAYCYECGEQIAENDVFCPYCGISIQPLAIANGEDDDSLDKTIIVQQPKAVTVAESAGDAADKIHASIKADEPQIRERLVGDFVSNKADDFSTDTTSKNIELTAGSTEISPAVVKPDTPLSETEAAEKAAIKAELLEMEKLFEEKTAEGNVSGNPAHEIEILEPLVAASETEVGCREDETDHSRANKSDQLSTQSSKETNLEPVFISTEGENVENAAGGFDSITETQTERATISEKELDNRKEFSAPVSAKEETPAFAAGENIASSNSPAIAEQPISMPDVELPVAESCPPSKFDSVNIMEKPATNEQSPEKIERGDAVQQQAPIVSAAAPETAEKDQESRSYTTPNIGGNDTAGKNKTKLKPLDEGTVLNGRYEIIRKIGGGGMGAVYLASDKNLGGVLRAVKEMVQSYIEDEQQEKAVSDFKRESLLLTSLDHPTIPTIYDYFFDEKEARFYLVMKYISGGDLAGRLRSAPESRIDELNVTQWAIQIADVLDYLHNRQPPIVYRDLKPANVMVDGNSGRVMLIDFGIARWVNKEEKGVTAVGTMGYAPPELFSGNVEARSDIYSLGSTMFHLLTGADPQSNPLLIFDFQKHPRPRQINPQLSDQMERILMRSVEYNADKRFANADEMRKTLEEHLENLKANRVTFGVKEAPVSVALSDQPVFCGFCGQKIVATDMFCAFCGAKQPLAQQGIHSHSEGYTPAKLTAQLLIIGTNELEQPAFRLEKDDNLVGRRDPMSNIFPEVDLSKFDPQTKISRRHARIWREGSEFMVEDLGSSNGTYILPVVSDTMRLQPHQPQLLTSGDKIRLGDTTLHFILG